MSADVLVPAWPIPTEDPYPVLARLRRSGPIHRLDDWDAWLVVSHPEAEGVLRGSGWSADPRLSPAAAARLRPEQANNDLLSKTVLFTDGADHQRLRRALAGYFTPRGVAGIQRRIAAVVDAAFTAHDRDQPWHVMDELAYPVPLAVICELLDTGVDLAERLRADTAALTALIDPMADAAAAEAGAGAGAGLMMDLVALVAERRARPGEDLLSALLDALAPDEAMMTALLLLVAGHETTANLIGNAVLVLHRNPGAARQLRENPQDVPRAVEELLRYESPVQLTARVALERQHVGDAAVSVGDQVFVSLGSANRDPDVFPDPDRMWPLRDSARHLAFGHGAHFCAGASLARAEAAEVLRRLLSADPPIEERALDSCRGSSATFRRVTRLVLQP